MLDAVNDTTASEDLAGEHRVKTALDQLVAIDISERRKTTRRKLAAAMHAAGAPYTPGELAAASGAAIALALRGTRGMRLTVEDWSDLRGALIVAAMEHGQRKNAERDERRTLIGQTGACRYCGAPASYRVTTASAAAMTGQTGAPRTTWPVCLDHGQRWPRQSRRMVMERDRPSVMPRREDLAGKNLSDGLAYLAGIARRMVADLAATGAADREHTTTASEDTPASEDRTDTLSTADLAAALGATTRERWACEVAAGAKSADLAAEHGKTIGAMTTALSKGRASLAGKTTPADLRAMADTLRENPPADGATIDLAGVTVPADLAERAIALRRMVADLRSNPPAPQWRGYLAIDRPTALVMVDGRATIVPAIGPVNVRHLAADLPTIDRRALRGRMLWSALGAPARRAVAYRAPRRYLTPGAAVTGYLAPEDLAAAQTIARNPRNSSDPRGGWQHGIERPPASVMAGGAAPTSRRAWGAMTPADAHKLAAGRAADLAAARERRAAERAEAERAGKLTVLPAATR